MIHNYPSLISLVINIGCFAVYLFFLTPKQLREVLQPRDWLTRLRWIILGILLASVLTAIPGLFYQYFRAVGQDYSVLRNIATVTSQISRLGTTILLVLVFTYRRKGD